MYLHVSAPVSLYLTQAAIQSMSTNFKDTYPPIPEHKDLMWVFIVHVKLARKRNNVVLISRPSVLEAREARTTYDKTPLWTKSAHRRFRLVKVQSNILLRILVALR